MHLAQNNHNTDISLADISVMAQADGESGGGYNPGDRLKMVDCECPDGTTGQTLSCKPDGDLELCTDSQQGSAACYKVGFFGLKLLCEGL